MAIQMISSYTLDTYGAKVALEKSWPLMRAAIDAMPHQDGFDIIDYGAADGGTAVEFFGQAFKALQQRFSDSSVSYIANDLPSNDQNALSDNLKAHRDAFDHVQTFISPVSFYEQVARPSTVDIGFSATAMHWLSRTPKKLTSHLHANQASNDERELYRKQALADFEHLLDIRAEEIKPGGHLVLVNLAESDEGWSLGKNNSDYSMFDEFKATWMEILDASGASEDQKNAVLMDTNFQNYYKNEADFLEVLNNDKQRKTWKLHASSIGHTACPYRAQFESDGDAVAFANGLMRTMRSWSRHVFEDAAKNHGLPSDTVDRFYQKLEEKFAANPGLYSMDYIHSFLHIERL